MLKMEDIVVYVKENIPCCGKIIEIHDPFINPYYTVKLYDGSVKQTESKYLKKVVLLEEDDLGVVVAEKDEQISNLERKIKFLEELVRFSFQKQKKIEESASYLFDVIQLDRQFPKKDEYEIPSYDDYDWAN